MLVLFEKFVRQAHGPVGIVSNCAVGDLNFQHGILRFPSHLRDLPNKSRAAQVLREGNFVLPTQQSHIVLGIASGYRPRNDMIFLY